MKGRMILEKMKKEKMKRGEMKEYINFPRETTR